MKIDWMLTILATCAVVVLVSFVQAHRRPGFDFNAFDLVMENGKVSNEKFTFMCAFAMTTWLMVDLHLKGKMTEGYLGLYIAAWVGPLVAKVVFKKTEMPAIGTTITSSTTTVASTEKANP